MADMNEGGIQGSTSAGNLGASESSSGVSAVTARGKEQLKRFSGLTRDSVFHRTDKRKKELVKNLDDIASRLESASEESEGFVGQVLDNAVGFVRRASDRLEHGSSEELLEEAREKVREQPGIFFIGCVAAGFLAARILKA